MGVAKTYRVTNAESEIHYDAGIGRFPDAVTSNPSAGVINYLKRSTSFIAGMDSAGHILAASMGGSNSQKENFFIQRQAENRGLFNQFETNIKDCLIANSSYNARFTVVFDYNIGNNDIKPDSYIARVVFFIKTAASEILVPRNALDLFRPQQCPMIKQNFIALGAEHMEYQFPNI